MKNNKALVMVVILSIIIIAEIVFSLSRKGNQATHNSVSGEKPIKIGIVVYPGFAPFNLAKEKGFFAKEGVNAEIVQSTDPNQLLASLASGEIQMLTCSADCATLIADAKIEAVQIFSTDESYGADGIVVKNTINSLQDLKGKRVYLPMGFPGHFLLRTLAARAGLTNQDITIEQMDADQVGAAFVAGKIDAGVTWEPWLSKATERKDGKVLLTSKDAPGIIVDTVFVRKDLLAADREAVSAVTRAYFDAVEFWKSNPQEADAIMGQSIGIAPEEFAAQIALSKLSDYNFSLEKFERTKTGSVFDLTEQASKIYLEDGVIKSAVDADYVTDASILQNLYK